MGKVKAGSDITSIPGTVDRAVSEFLERDLTTEEEIWNVGERMNFDEEQDKEINKLKDNVSNRTMLLQVQGRENKSWCSKFKYFIGWQE